MKCKGIIFTLILVFLGVHLFSPYADARRRPRVDNETEEALEEVELEEIKEEASEELIDDSEGEELTGSELEKYLMRDVSEEEEIEEEEETEETGFSAWTPTNAMLRSLMLPGWGQFFNEQYTKGYIFAGTEVVLLSTSLMLYSQANSAYNDYENGTASYDDYSKKLDNTNMVVGVFAAVWIYNVIDAYINASYEEEASLINRDGLALEIGNDQELSLLYKKNF